MTLEELLVQSIYDTDAITTTKQFVAEIQQYSDEVVFLIQNKHALDKAKEKKEETIQVTEAFSKMPENAAEF